MVHVSFLSAPETLPELVVVHRQQRHIALVANGKHARKELGVGPAALDLR